ncbi:hypothetical protein GHT06_013897 [Daphnia sinensis]|uniref:G-protein coupled receptors family 1 profile domain-containing protein n=1 Tax=Daphnia sinensis TaxID=1820382 RepID=A0AAD5PYC4_9CRUS|nr:hypothetical protein GHT06_013897 [Daphnia sinensis]
MGFVILRSSACRCCLSAHIHVVLCCFIVFMFVSLRLHLPRTHCADVANFVHFSVFLPRKLTRKCAINYQQKNSAKHPEPKLHLAKGHPITHSKDTCYTKNMNNNTNRSEDVILNENGDVYNPIDLNGLMISKCICCCVGIPLNASIAVALIGNHQLRTKPRIVFLLGIIFSYMSFFVVAIIELIYRCLYPVESVCQAYVACSALPQALLLLNLLLALGDRYLAIKHPLFHRRKMTERLACAIVIFSSILTVFVQNFAYIVGLRTLRCEVWLVRVKLVTITTSLLYVVCTVFNFIVYQETKNLLCEYRTICCFPSNAPLDITGKGKVVFKRQSIPTMSVHVDKKKLSQIIMQATRTLVIGVTSLAVTACPSIIFSCVFLGCRSIVDERQCCYLNWMGSYFQELGLISAVCSPIIFIVRQRELRLALTCARV